MRVRLGRRSALCIEFRRGRHDWYGIGIKAKKDCIGYTYGERGDDMIFEVQIYLVLWSIAAWIRWKKPWTQERCEAMGPIYKDV